jgi:hypothetical protein
MINTSGEFGVTIVDPSTSSTIAGEFIKPISTLSHNDLQGKQGGSVPLNQFEHLTSAQAADVAYQSEDNNFTGLNTVPTAVVDTDTKQIANCEFVINQGYTKEATLSDVFATKIYVADYTEGFAPLDSPTFINIVTVPDESFTYGKLQKVSVTDKILGRKSAGSGIIEEITCTAAGRALLDDASTTDQRTTLGLGNVTNESKSTMFTNPVMTGMLEVPSIREGQMIETVDHTVIVCDGDSRTVGYTGDVNYPYSEHFGYDATYYVYNTAMGGASLVYWNGVDCKADKAYANVDKYYSNIGIRNIVTIWAGYNDMYVNDMDQLKTYHALKAYAEQRRSKGWKVIVCTEINAASAWGGAEARRLAFNDLVRAGWAEFADGLCDLGNTTHFNTSTSYLDATYYYDGAHLTSTGYAAIGVAMKAAIDELINRPLGSYKSIVKQIYIPATAVTSANNVIQFCIPKELNGYKINSVAARTYTSATGYITVQIKNSNSAEALATNTVLTTLCKIYHGYYDSTSYGSPNSVVGNSNILVNEGYIISIDVVYESAQSGRKGLDVRIDFTK